MAKLLLRARWCIEHCIHQKDWYHFKNSIPLTKPMTMNIVA